MVQFFIGVAVGSVLAQAIRLANCYVRWLRQRIADESARVPAVPPKFSWSIDESQRSDFRVYNTCSPEEASADRKIKDEINKARSRGDYYRKVIILFHNTAGVAQNVEREVDLSKAYPDYGSICSYLTDGLQAAIVTSGLFKLWLFDASRKAGDTAICCNISTGKDMLIQIVSTVKEDFVN